MSIRNVLTRDLNESIRSCLGRAVKISMRCMVRMEVKPEKYENRVLAFSACRLFILTAKVPTRMDHHFHYMDIQALDSKCSTQFSLTVHDKKYLFSVVDDRHNEIDAMIINLGVSIKNIFPSVPLNHVVRKLEVVPPQRIQKLYEVCRLVEARDPGPCGGFSTQYACMCDYHGLPYREEVAWDVDTIYLSHDCRELNLHDFDHLDPKDLMPIISALEHNTWFTALRLSHIRLNSDSLERLLHVLKKSVSLEQIYLDNTGLKADFVHKLSMAMLSNTNCMLNVIDISHNPIEDKGAAHLAPILAKLTETPSGATHLASAIGRCSTGLQQLQLSGCALSCRGVGQLCQSLSLNRTAASTLHTLQLSANCLRDESAGLLTFLAQPNSIHTLQLSSCELTLDTIFGALLRGCTSHLVRLDLSRNMFNTKKSKDLPPSFKQFFTSSMALKHINLAGCRIPLEALKHLLLGLACNESTSEVELDISGNALAASGAHVLESCIHGIKCLSSLDLSDNGLEQDVCGVVAGVSRNRSLKSLNISHNIGQLKTKHMRLVVESIVQMIQDEDCALESLHVSDSRFKSELFALLNALGSNNCLQMLDISGNGMGDTGARLLAKALQINSRLRQINLDKNGVTIQGYSDIAYGLQSNMTLTYIPTPLSDLGACCKISAERSDVVWRRIEDLLHRNSLPPHSQRTSRQAFRLQQGFLLSSTQQMVDRLVGQIRLQAHHNLRASALLLSSSSSLPGSPTSSTAVDGDGEPLEATDSDLQLTAVAAADARQQLLEHAEAVCQDAENSKQLLSRFHGIVTEREDAGNPVEQQLSSAVDDIHSVIVQHIESTVSLMLDEAQQQCRRVLSAPVRAQMAGSCAERVRQARDDTHRLLMQCAGQQLAGQLQQLQLAAAAQLSDRVVDEVIATLTRTHRSLTGDLSCKRTSTPDVLKSHSRSTSASTIATAVAGGSYSSTAVDSNSCYSGDTRDDSTASHASELTPPATPQLQAKKINMLGRKLRPNSVVDFVEGVSADRIPDLLNDGDGDLASVEELDSVSELPGGAVGGGILRHLGKARPRRSKTRAPTRASAAPSAIGSDVDAGIHSFFSSTTTTSSLPGSPLTSPDADLSSSRLLMTTSADNTPNLGVTSRGLRHSASTSSTHQHRLNTEEVDPPRERRGSSLRKGISSVFSKLASDRVARSRGDRDGSHKKSPKPTADSHTSGADNFLNHLLTPVAAPAVISGGGDENHGCPTTAAPLRRPAAASSDQLLAEMRCKQQEKRISSAVPSTVDETPSAPSSPLSRPTAQLPAAPRARPRPAPRTVASSSDVAADPQPVATPHVSVDATPNTAAAANDDAVGSSGKPCLPGNGGGGRLPPIAPKPRPKSLVDVATIGVPVAAPSDDVDDDNVVDVSAASTEATSSRSVRQMAAQLNKNKPTDAATADGVGVASAGDRRSRRLVAADMLELEGSSADGPRSLPSIYVSAERRAASPSSAPYCSDEVINV